MADFFFHFFDGQNWSRDSAGIELTSAEEAYIQAMAAARGMWPELLAERCNPLRCAFEIADMDGHPLFRVAFSELLDNCRNSRPAPRNDEAVHLAIEAEGQPRAR